MTKGTKVPFVPFGTKNRQKNNKKFGGDYMARTEPGVACYGILKINMKISLSSSYSKLSLMTARNQSENALALNNIVFRKMAHRVSERNSKFKKSQHL